MGKPIKVTLWVWRTAHELNAHTLKRYTQDFSSSERQKIDSFGSQKRKQSYITGHYLLRKALTAFSPDWSQFSTIQHSTHAPPQLHGSAARQLRFNLSHSGNTVCCTVSNCCRLGVDIELYRQTDTCERISTHFFASSEISRIAAMVGMERVQEFYKLWTLKESLIKARETGINSQGLRQTFQPSLSNTTSWKCYAFDFHNIFHCGLSVFTSDNPTISFNEYCGDTNTTINHDITPNVYQPDDPIT